MISSMDAQRRKIYIQQPTMSAGGLSGQCFNTHFPHTVRKRETQTCTDCHVSDNNDNNAWMAQVLLLGTNMVNFVGYHAYVGLEKGGLLAVQVTEWDEPQAVIGSELHRLAFPDQFKEFVEGGRILKKSEHHSGPRLASVLKRGEYLYTAGGRGGFRVYDIANVANKDFSEKIVTAPFSPIGQDTHESLPAATAVTLPTTAMTTLSRMYRPENGEQRYEYNGEPQNLHETYRYAYVTDLERGLVVIDVDKLTDGNPLNNFTEIVAEFNPDGQLSGARTLHLAGTTAYVGTETQLVAINLEDPRAPTIRGRVDGFHDIRGIEVQFRYAFVIDESGLSVVDITFPDRIRRVPDATIGITTAQHITVTKTYAYISAKEQGLVIVDVEKPENPQPFLTWNAEGQINDLRQMVVGMTNDTVFGYLADGKNGLRVVSLIAPGDGEYSHFGFSPPPAPKLIATYPTKHPAISVSPGLDRDRAVDESGHQTTVFGRVGARPMNLEEMQKLYLRRDSDGKPQLYTVKNRP